MKRESRHSFEGFLPFRFLRQEDSKEMTFYRPVRLDFSSDNLNFDLSRLSSPEQKLPVGVWRTSSWSKDILFIKAAS